MGVVAVACLPGRFGRLEGEHHSEAGAPPPSDAGKGDAGTLDASKGDAGTLDAGRNPPDSPDAGSGDAGSSPGPGSPFDAGPTQDAGKPYDAGPEPRDGGQEPADAGDAGPKQCRRPEGTELVLTQSDLVPIARVKPLPTLASRALGPSVWLGKRRVFLVQSTNPKPSEPPIKPYPSATFEGAMPPWLQPSNEVQEWTFSDVTDEKGLPLPLLAPAADDGDDFMSPVGIIRALNSFDGVIFLQRVSPFLNVKSVWLATIPDGSTVAVREPNPLFVDTERMFALGVHRAVEHVRLYSCEVTPGMEGMPDDPLFTRCYLARVPTADVKKRESYQVYRREGNQDIWDPDLSKGTPVLFGPSASLSVAWNSYLHKFVALYNKPYLNKLVVQTAPAPEGPWKIQGTFQLPRFADPYVHMLSDIDCLDRLVLSYYDSTANDGTFSTAGDTVFATIDLR